MRRRGMTAVQLVGRDRERDLIASLLERVHYRGQTPVVHGCARQGRWENLTERPLASRTVRLAEVDAALPRSQSQPGTTSVRGDTRDGRLRTTPACAAFTPTLSSCRECGAVTNPAPPRSGRPSPP